MTAGFHEAFFLLPGIEYSGILTALLNVFAWNRESGPVSSGVLLTVAEGAQIL